MTHRIREMALPPIGFRLPPIGIRASRVRIPGTSSRHTAERRGRVAVLAGSGGMVRPTS